MIRIPLRCILLVLAGVSALCPARDALALQPDEIALVANSNVPDGIKLAQFYAQQRHIPDNRILVLDLPKADQMPCRQYEDQVVPQVRDFIHSAQLEGKLKCLVTFYGVPLRIELGPRDLARGAVVVADRLSGEKQDIGPDEFVAEVSERLVAFQAALYQRALDFRAEHTTRAATFEELVAGVEDGFCYAFLCGEVECEERIQQETGATPRCIPRDGEEATGVCAACGKPSAYGKPIVFARAY